MCWDPTWHRIRVLGVQHGSVEHSKLFWLKRNQNILSYCQAIWQHASSFPVFCRTCSLTNPRYDQTMPAMHVGCIFPLHASYFRSFGDFFLVQRFGGRVRPPASKKANHPWPTTGKVGSWKLGPKNDVWKKGHFESPGCYKSSSCSPRPQVEFFHPLKNPGLAPVSGFRFVPVFQEGLSLSRF